MTDPTLADLTLIGTSLGQRLSLVGDRMTPNLFSNVLSSVINADGTQPYAENLKFLSVVGVADDLDVEIADQVPENIIRYILHCQVSHNGASTQTLHQGLRWEREAGVTTSLVALSDSNRPTNSVSALPSSSRVLLPPTGRMYARALALDVGAQLTLSCGFVDVPLGATFPR